MNIINGGVHARGQGADFQEFMIAPHGASTLTEAVRQGSEVYQALRQILVSRDLSAAVGDEGGFAPAVSSNREPLEFIVQAIEKAGYRPGKTSVSVWTRLPANFIVTGNIIFAPKTAP